MLIPPLIMKDHIVFIKRRMRKSSNQAYGYKLHHLIKEFKGKKLEDGKGLRGKGRLMISRIDAIQSFTVP